LRTTQRNSRKQAQPPSHLLLEVFSGLKPRGRFPHEDLENSGGK
jgi:hypothetical protein